MKKLILILMLVAMAVPAKAQVAIPEFDFGSPFGLACDYNFSAEQEVVGCSLTRTDSCIKELRFYDVTKIKTLMGVVPAPEGATAPVVDITLVVTGYKKMGNRQFVATAVDSTGAESKHSVEALAKFLPPEPVGTNVKTPLAP